MCIVNLQLIGSNGEVVPEHLSSDERRRLFPPLGIIKVVSLKWICDGRPVQIDVQDCQWLILPDRSGVAVVSRQFGKDTAYVLNADGDIRFKLNNPWPRTQYYEPIDQYGFSYPSIEKGRLGFVVYVWRPAPGKQSGTSVEHFFEVDARTGDLLGFHPIK